MFGCERGEGGDAEGAGGGFFSAEGADEPVSAFGGVEVADLRAGAGALEVVEDWVMVLLLGFWYGCLFYFALFMFRGWW